MTQERYGNGVDDRSAALIDRLDAAFEDSPYNIVDHGGLAINNNRHMTIRFEPEYATHYKRPGGKVPSEVFNAVREAGLHVTGVHTGIGDESSARIWVEPQGAVGVQA